MRRLESSCCQYTIASRLASSAAWSVPAWRSACRSCTRAFRIARIRSSVSPRSAESGAGTATTATEPPARQPQTRSQNRGQPSGPCATSSRIQHSSACHICHLDGGLGSGLGFDLIDPWRVSESHASPRADQKREYRRRGTHACPVMEPRLLQSAYDTSGSFSVEPVGFAATFARAALL